MLWISHCAHLINHSWLVQNMKNEFFDNLIIMLKKLRWKCKNIPSNKLNENNEKRLRKKNQVWIIKINTLNHFHFERVK